MSESIMFIKENLSQKFSFGKRFNKKSIKRLITHLVLLAFINQNLAFATNGIIELDFEGSENPQRLHMLLPSSKTQDVSYVEIDTEQKQVTLYKKRDGEEVYPLAPFSLPSVAVYQGDVAHNLWGLEQETIKLFLQANQAWLIPLDEDGYKLEFKGRLLGGMKPSGGNQTNVSHCSKAPKTDNFCWVQGGNFYAPDSSWTGKNPGNISIMSNPNYSQTGGGGGSKGTRSGGSRWQGILGRGWAEIKANGDKARERMRQQQENLKKLSTVGQSVPIYKRPEIIIPESPFPRVQTYQPSTKEPFQTGSSPEAQYSRLRVLYNMADRWNWSEIYQYAKAIGVSTEDIEKYNLTQRHAKNAGFSWEFFKETNEEEVRNALKQKQEEEEREKIRQQYEEESSHAGSSLFDDVSPEYFTRVASDAGMTPSQALHAILNPDPDNFYNRIMLVSRQNWLGGKESTTAFTLEGLTNAQAYDYIKQGYHKGDMPTIFNKIIATRGSSLFEGVTPDYFVKQAEKANMLPFQALSLIFNPTAENFYDRVRLASRQDWLGGKEDTTVFELEDLTNFQAYQYYLQGYKAQDFPTLSNKRISQRGGALFDVAPDYFSKQAEKAGMTPMEALAILMNPTLENAYERVLLASRQNYLGGRDDLFVFRDMGITVGEAYNHLLSQSKTLVSFAELRNDSTNKVIKDEFNQFCTEKQQENLKEQERFLNSFDSEDWGDVVQLIPVGKMFKPDPMSPHDYFDLEGKMGGSGIMAGGSGGGKLSWGRIFGKQKQLSEQQIKTANNVIQKIQHRTRLQLQEKGILDAKGNLTKKTIENSAEVKLKEPLKNPDVIKELTKNGTKIEDWKKMETIESIILPNGNKAKVHFYKNSRTGEVNTNIDFKLKGNVPLENGFREL